MITKTIVAGSISFGVAFVLAGLLHMSVNYVALGIALLVFGAIIAEGE